MGQKNEGIKLSKKFWHFFYALKSNSCTLHKINEANYIKRGEKQTLSQKIA